MLGITQDVLMDEQVVMKTAPESEWKEMEDTILNMSVTLNEKDKLLERYILRINEIGKQLDAMDMIDIRLTEAKDMIREIVDGVCITEHGTLDEDIVFRLTTFLQEIKDEELRKANEGKV